MEGEGICLGCMAEKGSARICPTCGYKEGTPPESPLHLKPGTVLNRKYLIGRALGHGGFGITYLGLDLNLRVKLAVKEYFPTGLVTRDATAQTVSVFSGDRRESFHYGLGKFLEEARTLAKFSNVPEIVGVRDFLQENGTAYLVMDYVEGITLKEYLARQGGKLPLDAALTFVMPVVHALEKVHASGMLHRDVSPDNIFVTSDFHVKLLDFGSARYDMSGQSQSLSVMLKQGYSPEEQYRSRGKQGPWTDVYATAATLYKLLTGETPPEALDRMAGDDLKPLSAFGFSLPESYEKAIQKALSVRAGERYQTMAEFEAALTGEIEEDAAAKPKSAAEKPVPQKDSAGVAVPFSENRVPVSGTEPFADAAVPMPDEQSGNEGETETTVSINQSYKEEDNPSRACRTPKRNIIIAAAIFVMIVALLGLASNFIGYQSHDSVPTQATSSSGAPAQSEAVPAQAMSSAEASSSGAAQSTPGKPSSATPTSSARPASSAPRASSAPKASASSAAQDNAPEQANTVGNTCGNIANFGLVAQQGNWIYYRSNNNSLCKIRNDGTAHMQICSDDVEYINVLGDWIIYRNDGDDGKLYKIRSNGTSKTKLNNEFSFYINVVGGWIYYYSNESGLCKIKTDGTEKAKLSDDNAADINVKEDWIYYINKSDGGKLYKIKIDGTSKVKLNNDLLNYLDVSGNWIYYQNGSDNNSLYKIETDGTGRTKLNSDYSACINAVGDWIYYCNGIYCGSLCKIRADGSGKIRLNDDNSSWINVADTWIYYSIGNDSYRIRTDGTQRQLVS